MLLNLNFPQHIIFQGQRIRVDSVVTHRPLPTHTVQRDTIFAYANIFIYKKYPQKKVTRFII